MRIKSILSLSLLTCVSLPIFVNAQIHRGVIRGRVTDVNGGVIQGVSLKAIRIDTEEARSTDSNNSGEYVFSHLPPGNYRLEIKRTGFRSYEGTTSLQLNQELRLDLVMAVAGPEVTQSVSFQVDLKRRDSAALGVVVENQQLSNLPLDGRNFMELSLLAAGASPSAPGSSGSVRGDFAFNVNGAREDANNFLLDGVYNVDPKLNTFGVKPPVDAIQEFEVISGGYDASLGRNAGAQVNVILKSGTNGMHGTIYEFFRNAALDARNYFAPPGEADPKYQRNQFGFSLGGPIIKGRTFFFTDYEGLRERNGQTRITNVPTAAERTGDFSNSYLPAPINPFDGQPFANRKIPVQALNPIGVRIAALFPLPNRAVPFQNFVSSPTLRDRNDHFDLRIDHTMKGSWKLAGRYSFSDRELFEPFSGSSFAAVPGYGTNIPRRGQNAMISATRIFSPLLINETRFAFNRIAAGAFQENQGTSINKGVGLPEVSANPRDWGLSFISVPGFSTLGDEYNNPQHSVTNTFQVLDTATYSRGSHLLKFGFEFRANQQNGYRDVQARGFLNFVGLYTQNPLADLLIGLPIVTGSAKVDNHQHLRTQSYNGFVNDSYHIRPWLTLLAGLRYEYNTPSVDAFDRANVYDPVSRALVKVGTNGIPRSGYDADRNNFVPRIGFAWTLGKRELTVLRGGYGVFLDQAPLAPGEALYFNPPYYDFVFNFPTQQLPLTLYDPFPNTFAGVLPRSALAIQRDLRTPYLQHWNLNLQQGLGGNRLLEIGYVGTKGTKLLSSRDINQPQPGPQLPAPYPPYLRPVPQFEDIIMLESRSNSSYHSLQVSFQQRLSAGLSVLSAYTWSKSLDDASNFFSSTGDPNFPQNSFNVRAERGRSNFDIRHRLSLSYSYDFPFGSGNKWISDRGWISAVLGGWSNLGVMTFQGGRPFTVALLAEEDNSNTGRASLGFGANDRPNLVGNARLEVRTPERWFNVAAFAKPAFGNFGSAGRNVLDGPGYANVNFSLTKKVALTEQLMLQFRAETFNLFNRPNFDLPDNFFGSPSFGRIRSAQSPRHIQFGLKLLF